MKALCAISSVEFNVEHFPGTLYSREICHPVFYLPQKKLLSYLPKWSSHGLTDTDSYLLFLALLNSTELVKFRVPVFRNERTNAIVAQNMEFLAKVVSQINTVTTPSFNFMQVGISPETRYLDNVHHWLEDWNESYKQFLAGYPSAHDNAKIIRREKALERLIKSAHRDSSKYAHAIADWAADAGDFPTFLTLNPYTSSRTQISCSDYWKSIIIKCASEENIYAIDRKDVMEILTHCEDNIPIGSIYSNALFSILRRALEKQKNFLGLGDIDISQGKYQFVTETDSVESANMKAMIDSAPVQEPKPEAYPTKLAYLRAKMRWEMSQASVQNLPDGE